MSILLQKGGGCFLGLLLLGVSGINTQASSQAHSTTSTGNTRWWGFGTPEENGLPGGVSGFVGFGGNLVAFGGFFQPSGMHCIGAWDGARWELLGAGVFMKHPAEPCNDDCTPWISSAVPFGGDLLVGGRFRYAGGYFSRHRADNLAKWNGMNWQPVGVGTDGDVEDLLLYDNSVVVIGSFTMAGGVAAAGIARWDGSAWFAMDSGSPGAIAYTTVWRSNLFASSYLSNELFRWSGSDWQAVGQVMRASPLGVYRDSLVARVEVVEEAITRRRIATWAGAEWVPIGGRLPSELGSPDCFAEFEEHLFVGGSLPEYNNIAEWTGASWDSLGSGVGPGLFPHVSYGVGSLQVWGGSLFVGGDFIAAGHKTSYRIARWDLETTSVEVEAFEAWAVEGGVQLGWHLSGADLSEITGIEVERADVEAGPYERRTTQALAPSRAMQFLDHDEGISAARWYRLRLTEVDGAIHFAGPIVVDAGQLASTLTLSKSSGRVEVRYRLARPSASISLDVYSANGRLVRTLVRGAQSRGEHMIAWDQRRAGGESVARGVYFVRLRADRTLTRRVVLLDSAR